MRGRIHSDPVESELIVESEELNKRERIHLYVKDSEKTVGVGSRHLRRDWL